MTSNITKFPRKPIEQVFSETATRVSELKNASELEKNTLIAICVGDPKEAQRLLDVAIKMKKNQMMVIPRPIFEELQNGANLVRADKNIPAIERNLLASILEGDHINSARLFALNDKVKELKLKVV